MVIDISQYRDLYIQTARDLVSAMQKHINHLSTNANDKKTIYELYRAVHSLKSQSLMMGYTQLGLTNRLAEALFKEIHEGKQTLSNEVLSLMTEVVSHMKNSLDQIQNKNQEADLRDDIKKLQMYISLEK